MGTIEIYQKILMISKQSLKAFTRFLIHISDIPIFIVIIDSVNTIISRKWSQCGMALGVFDASYEIFVKLNCLLFSFSLFLLWFFSLSRTYFKIHKHKFIIQYTSIHPYFKGWRQSECHFHHPH